MVLHIVNRVGDEFVLAYFAEPDVDSYRTRYRVSADALDAFDVGDVIEQVEGNRWNLADGSFEPVADDVAQAVRDAYEPYRTELEEYAAEYGVDLDTTTRSVEDGGVVLASTPGGARYDVGDTVFVSPPGLYRAGDETARDLAGLVNVDTSALESGLAFEVVETDDVCVFEYDAAETDAARSGPAQVEILCTFERLTEVHDWLDTRSDFEPPFYVLVDGFDDGQFYSRLYDSAGDGDGRDALRELCGASARFPQTIPREWPYSGEFRVVPVSELHLGENEYSDRPVAILDRDAEPVRP